MIYFNTIFLVTLYVVSAISYSPTDHGHLRISSIANSPISKISYNSSGGKSGSYESLDISPDSVIYVQGRRGVEKWIKEKTIN
jgi:hypothetical protein